jgi:ferrous iron transport protein B
MTTRITIAGNPNCGKTTLFNKLTGSKQKIGNWPGVTVEKKIGSFHYADTDFSVTDLPGIYSLTVAQADHSIDERIAMDFLLSRQTDILINIVDAANLKRNLYLTLQLSALGIPCILVLNMMDIAYKRRLRIDIEKLSQHFDLPVIAISLNQKKGLSTLKKTIVQMKTTARKSTINSQLPYFQSLVELCQTHPEPLWCALSLLEKDVLTQQWLEKQPQKDSIQQFIAQLEQNENEMSDVLLAQERYATIQTIVDDCVAAPSTTAKSFTERIDRIVMHRYLGIPIFLGIMYLMFELSMNLGSLFQPLFDLSSTALLINGPTHWGAQWGIPAGLTAIFANGLGVGINTVLNFIPQIGFMFLFMAFLEDSGYMARAAFVMDRLMQAVGLPGKSFIPLIVGFGCNVPSIMATRTLDSTRDRIVTALMAPFMSCGARLAIFVVFASAFFPQHSGLVIFSLYIIGICVAMLTGFILQKTVFKRSLSPFIQELPIYHTPHLHTLWLLTWQRLRGFVLRAGRMIVPVCILIGSLNSIHLNDNTTPLSWVGKAITPVLAPMGIQHDNWPASVSLITGTMAKEVVIGSLNTLYSQENAAPNDTEFNLGSALKTAVTTTLSGIDNLFSAQKLNPFTANEADHAMNSSAMTRMQQAFGTSAAAFSYLLFVLLYIPCISTMGVLNREIGKQYAWLATIWSFDIAYVVAVIFYQSTQIFSTPLSAIAWIAGIVLIQCLGFIGLKHWAQKPHFKALGSTI